MDGNALRRLLQSPMGMGALAYLTPDQQDPQQQPQQVDSGPQFGPQESLRALEAHIASLNQQLPQQPQPVYNSDEQAPPPAQPVYAQMRAIQKRDGVGEQQAYSQVADQYQPERDRGDRIPMNSVRNNDTGEIIYLGQQGPTTNPQTQGAPQSQSGTQLMGGPIRAIGAGNGTVAELSPEVAPGKVNLDYSRPPVEIMGTKAYYSKDQPGVAYAVDGSGRPTAKVYLGYDLAGSLALQKGDLANQKTRQDIAQSQASIEHTQEQIRASKVNNPDFMAMTGQSGQPSGITGNSLLQQLPPQTAAQVKALAEGRQQFPAGFAIKAPYWQNMLSLVAQYDPSFDATNYNIRAKTRADAATGVMAKSNNALNTVAEHLGNLSDKIDPLDTVSGFPGATLVNNVINAVEGSAGSTNITDFNSTKGHVAEELVRAWRGVGGNESDIQRNLQDLDASKTKAQLHSVVANIADLIAGKIAANENQYRQGMGAAADVNSPQFVSPTARTTFQRIAARSGKSFDIPGENSAVSSGAPSVTPAGIPPPEQRKLGQVYSTPKGPLRWAGNGWATP